MATPLSVTSPGVPGERDGGGHVGPAGGAPHEETGVRQTGLYWFILGLNWFILVWTGIELRYTGLDWGEIWGFFGIFLRGFEALKG